MTKTPIEGMSDCMRKLVLCCFVCNGIVWRNSYGIRGCVWRASMYKGIGFNEQCTVRQRASSIFVVILQGLVKLHICLAVDGIEVDGAKIDISVVRSLISLSPAEYTEAVHHLQFSIASRVTVKYSDVRLRFSAAARP